MPASEKAGGVGFAPILPVGPGGPPQMSLFIGKATTPRVYRENDLQLSVAAGSSVPNGTSLLRGQKSSFKSGGNLSAHDLHNLFSFISCLTGWLEWPSP